MAASVAGLVSVLLPVRDCVGFLPEAINSILAQTYSRLELIVLDDGSTDGSGQCARDVGLGDARVRVEETGGQGLVHALNIGIQLARGEYVARMDADDVSMPSRFERQVEYLAKNHEVAVVGGGAIVIDAEGRKGRRLTPPTSHASICRALIRQKLALIHPTVMFRRPGLVESGGYREQFAVAEDYDLWLRLSELYKIANLSEVVLQLRKHTGNISVQRGGKQAISVCLAVAVAGTRRMGFGDAAATSPALFDEALLEATHLVGASGLAEDIRKRAAAGEVFRGLLRLPPWHFAKVPFTAFSPRILFVRRKRLRLAHQLTRWLVGRYQAPGSAQSVGAPRR